MKKKNNSLDKPPSGRFTTRYCEKANVGIEDIPLRAQNTLSKADKGCRIAINSAEELLSAIR
jgi:hypothetical protein